MEMRTWGSRRWSQLPWVTKLINGTHSFNKYLWSHHCVLGSGNLMWGQDWDLRLLTPEFMLLPWCQLPWHRSCVGPSVLVPRGSEDDSVPAFPLHTGHPLA